MSTRKDTSSLISLEYKCSIWLFNSTGPLTTHIFYKALESNKISKCYLKVKKILKYRRMYYYENKNVLKSLRNGLF